MTYVNTRPIDRLAKYVENYYLTHPHLMEALLRNMGADEIRPHGNQIRSTCPLHKGKNPEGFGLYWDKGFPAWKCFSGSCGKGNLFTMMMRKHGGRFDESVVSLGRFAGLETDGVTIEVSDKAREEESEHALRKLMGVPTTGVEERINVFPDHMLESSVATLRDPQHQAQLDYFVQRGYSPAELDKWEVGFVRAKHWLWPDPEHQPKPGEQPRLTGWWEDRISIPWRYMDGTLMGFAGRRIDGNPLRKYKTLPGTKRALMLYGMHRPECLDAIRSSRVLHLVEGYTDVWRAHQFGCFNTATLGGTELTSQQLKLIASFDLERVVIFLDGDGAGVDGTSKVADQLASLVSVYAATPPGGKDPDDLKTYQEFWTPLMEQRPFFARRQS